MKYKVILHKEENGYSVEVPALEGCFSQGKTFQEAIVCYIESLIKDGEQIPSDDMFLKSVKINEVII